MHSLSGRIICPLFSNSTKHWLNGRVPDRFRYAVNRGADFGEVPRVPHVGPGRQHYEGAHHGQVEHVGEGVEPDQAKDLTHHITHHRDGSKGDGCVGCLEDVLVVVESFVVLEGVGDFGLKTDII